MPPKTTIKVSFTFHTKMPTLNEYVLMERGNRHAAAKSKKTVEAGLVAEMLQQRPRGIRWPLSDVSLSYVWIRKDKRTDKSNIMFCQKFVEDALQGAGILKNDGWNNIQDIFHQFFIDHQGPRLELIITGE